MASMMLCSCGGDSPPVMPASASELTAFDVALVGTVPAAGAALLVTPPNDRPVDLSVTFSVRVPRGSAGTYLWNTAVQAEQPLGFAIVPIATTTFLQVPLVEGVQSVTIAGFRSTNAICIQPERTAAATTSLDVDLRPPGSSTGQIGTQVVGRRFPTTFKITCLPRTQAAARLSEPARSPRRGSSRGET